MYGLVIIELSMIRADEHTQNARDIALIVGKFSK